MPCAAACPAFLDAELKPDEVAGGPACAAGVLAANADAAPVDAGAETAELGLVACEEASEVGAWGAFLASDEEGSDEETEEGDSGACCAAEEGEAAAAVLALALSRAAEVGLTTAVWPLTSLALLAFCDAGGAADDVGSCSL